MSEKKRMLIYAHYYVPDVASTGQLITELAEGVKDKFDVTVICVVPSYSGKIDDYYRKHRYYKEEINGIHVLRVRVSEFNKTSHWSRVRNITGYFTRALIATFQVGRQDYVFSISQPPILGGLLGVWGKWIKKAKFIYNIQDFNPEQVAAVGYNRNRFLQKIMIMLDKYSCKKSDLVITVGRDLISTMEKRFKGRNVPRTILINNWIDEKKIYPLEESNPKVINFRRAHNLEDKYVFMYSGNIGLYYDLENIIKVIENFRPGTKTRSGKEVVFAFVGAGAVKQLLEDYVVQHQMSNVVFIPYQDKDDLIYSLNAGDVHWCMNAKGIKGVSCPSKYYGLAAAGKPVLGVLEPGTEIRMLMEACDNGLCCDPGDYDAIRNNIEWFIEAADTDVIKKMGNQGRQYLERHLTKAASLEKYKEVISML